MYIAFHLAIIRTTSCLKMPSVVAEKTALWLPHGHGELRLRSRVQPLKSIDYWYPEQGINCSQVISRIAQDLPSGARAYVLHNIPKEIKTVEINPVNS